MRDQVTNYFSYPASVNIDKEIYVISHQKLFRWSNNVLSCITDFASPTLKNLQISDDGETVSYVSQEYSAGDIYIYKPNSNLKPERITFFDDSRIYNIGFRGDKVLFSSAKYSDNRFSPNIYEVGPDKQPILIYKNCVSITFSSDHMVVLQRFGSSYRRWRNYKGGAAARLFLKKEGGDFVKLNLPENNCYSPVFVGTRLFFLSDYNSGVANIYEYDFNQNHILQRTHHKHAFIRSLKKCGADKLIYTIEGNVHIYDCNTNRESDFLPIYGSYHTSLQSEYISAEEIKYTDFAVDNKGDNVVVACRGKILTLDRSLNIIEEHASEMRHRLCAFLTDNQLIFGKDQGENTVIRFFDKKTDSYYKEDFNPQMGFLRNIIPVDSSSAILISYAQKVVLFSFSDQQELIPVFSEKRYIRGIYLDISPDKNWITYSLNDEDSAASNIYVYHIPTRESRLLLANGMSHFSPVFSKDGKYIYFLTSTYTCGKYSEMFFEVNFSSKEKIGAICLSDDARNPFEPPFEIKDDKEQEADKKEDVKVEIDFDNIKIVYSSIPADRYRFIADLGSDKLFLAKKTNTKMSVSVFCIKSNETTQIADNICSFALSNSKEMLITLLDSKLRVTKSDTPFNDKDKSYKNGGWCNLEGYGFKIDRAEEWKNIIEQTWELFKQKFWNPSELNDWEKIKNQALQVLPRIKSRRDLNFIIQEMIGAGATSHAYLLRQGDVDEIHHNSNSSLFADFEWNEDGYKLTRMHQVYDEDGLCASPLKQVGVKIDIGDKIISIDGENIKKGLPIEAYLAKKDTGKIALTVCKANGKVVKQFVEPCRKIVDILYHTWVQKNKEYVQSIDKRIGYIHIPDMSIKGLSLFRKQYRAQYSKALIIDVRHNGGGNVSSLIMQWLRNVRLGETVLQDHKTVWPDGSNNGIMVALINQSSGSDGDLFCLQVKQICKTIGTRTWGGIHGIWPEFEFVDGSLISVPEFGTVIDSGLQIENRGVEPDFEVENKVEEDKDLQLEYAINYIKEQLDDSGFVLV